MTVYPNPFRDEIAISINLNEAEILNIAVIDASGRTLFSTGLKADKGGNVLPLQLESLPAGCTSCK